MRIVTVPASGVVVERPGGITCEQPSPYLRAVPGIEPHGAPALREPRPSQGRAGSSVMSDPLWGGEGGRQRHVLGPSRPEGKRGDSAERCEPSSLSVYPAAKHPGVVPPPHTHTHTLSLGRSALTGENMPERVPWPPAQQPALSRAGPRHPTSQTTVFDSLLRGCQVELLSHSALAGGAERHRFPRRR